MLQVGKIKNYNSDRGFGFIESDDTKSETFFHIKDFPKGQIPKIGEKITYSIRQHENKLKAVNIVRLDVSSKIQHNKKRTYSSSDIPSEKNSFVSLIFSIILIGAVIYFIYGYISDAMHRSELTSQPVTMETIHIANQRSEIATQSTEPNHQFKCDGRIHCSQLSSKTEAKWFLNNCPGTKMDGDHDGDPCEQQFGNGW